MQKLGRVLPALVGFLVTVLVAAWLGIQHIDAQAPKENPLLVAVRDELHRVNPAIQRVVILELRRATREAPYVVIGYGNRAAPQFTGDFRDELFGVFVADESLTRIERTLEIIPTPRWLDYMVRIDRIADDEVTIVGAGTTYGDQPLRRTYALSK